MSALPGPKNADIVLFVFVFVFVIAVVAPNLGKSLFVEVEVDQSIIMQKKYPHTDNRQTPKKKKNTRHATGSRKTW